MEYWQIIIAYTGTFIFTWLIGFERQNMSKSAGISPHVLVAMSVCSVAIMQKKLGIEAMNNGYDPETQRLLAQMFSGIGFLGAGVIMKSDRNVTGLTTATTIFSSAVIGALFGSGFFILGLALGVFVVSFMFIRDIHRRVNPFKKAPPLNYRNHHHDE